MSEYWKSNPKKFCEYCRIWIQANKASISIHENGSIHKDKVRKRLLEIKKKSIEKKNEEKEFGKSMAAIERAAVSAMQTDVLNNPSLRTQYGLEVKPSEALSSLRPSTSKAFKSEEKVFKQDKPIKRPLASSYDCDSKIGKWENMEHKKLNREKNDLQLPVKIKILENKLEEKKIPEIEVKSEFKEEDFKNKWKPVENCGLAESEIVQEKKVQENEPSIDIKKEPNEEKIPLLKNAAKKEKDVKFKKRTKEINVRQRTDE